MQIKLQLKQDLQWNSMSQMANIETIMTAFVDFSPALRRYKPLVAGGICFVMFLLGFTMCLQV